MSTVTNRNLDNLKQYKKRSQLGDIWHRFCKNKSALAGLIIFLIILVAALSADLFYDYNNDAIKINIKERLTPPSAAHILGTDELGRDILCRIVYGARVSLEVGILATTFALFVGGILGAIAGYYGGKVDQIIMRAMDVLLAIPGLLMAIAMMAAFGQSVFNMTMSLGVSYISKFAVVVRSAILSVRGQEYVEAARAIGCKDRTIIGRHVLINCMAPIIVNYALAIGTRITSVSTLSYIGMGVQAPTPDWGCMLSSGRAYMRGNGYLVLAPGLAIMLTITAFNLMGDGLRDALDPRLKN